MAIGDFVLDLSAIEGSIAFKTILEDLNPGCKGDFTFQSEDLGAYASLPAPTQKRVRQQLIDWLTDCNSPLFQDNSLKMGAFVPMNDVTMHLPFKIGAFADFMCSDVHVDNVRCNGDLSKIDLLCIDV